MAEVNELFKQILQELEAFANREGDHRALAYAADWIAKLKALYEGTGRPEIVCLCGSAMFAADFIRISIDETRAGNIVLSLGAASGVEQLTPTEEIYQQMEELHLHKINIADRVRILNIGGYMSERTRRELEHARRRQKRIQLEEPLESGPVYPQITGGNLIVR